MLADLRYAFRMVGRNPGFAAVAVLSLALGIGANTAIFTLIDSLVLKSLPVRSPGQLAVIARNPDKPSPSFNYPDYVYFRDHNQSYSGVLAATGGGTEVAFSIPDEKGAAAEMASGMHVSGNYFEVLGVGAAMGRVFTPADDRIEKGHPYAVLSYDFWQRRLGSDPQVVGRVISLNGVRFSVVGVTERGFHGTAVGNAADIFLPIMMMPAVNPGVRGWNSRHYWWLNVMARLKPGATLASATSEADVLWQQILKADPEYKPAPAYQQQSPNANRMIVLPGGGGWSFLRRQFAKPLTVLMIVVGLVLLIACANVANLLLARAAGRQKEIAVRLAIGASRSRLVSQLLVETLVISVLGGLAGLAFAWFGVNAILSLLPKSITPTQLYIKPDLRVLGFAFTTSLLTGLICGLVPALQATRPDLATAIKEGAAAGRRSRFDLRRMLVTAQVAISMLLLIGAGLFVRTLSNLENLDPGFRREGVLLVGMNSRSTSYQGQRLRDYYERLAAAVARQPGVRSVALANITPLSNMRWNGDISIQGYQWKPDEKPYVDFNSVSSAFFETVGIPLIEGRSFTKHDSPAVTPEPGVDPDVPLKVGGPRVMIINQTMAKRFFPHQSALGARICMSVKFKMEEAYEVVGVVGDARYFGVRTAAESMVYLPLWADGAGRRTLCVRANAPGKLGDVVRREAAAIDPAVPVVQMLTLGEQYDSSIAQERMLTMLGGFFGSLALLLAAVGLYGLMAHAVTRRVREIGIRMALGAEASEVRWMILRETLLMVCIGAAIGIPVALWLTRLLESYLFDLTPQDPMSIAMSTLVLPAVTVLAGYIPARRATRVDPMIALRYE